MTVFGKTLLGAVAGAGILAFSAGNASAYIACSRNVCWHMHLLKQRRDQRARRNYS